METRSGSKIAIKILHPKNYLDSEDDASDTMIDENIRRYDQVHAWLGQAAKDSQLSQSITLS